ncbi:MAG TPA: TIGR01777 family oxidoreductase [Pyrinomonadaceae bacterium]|nr:TIGR01777 family oxidoreductase [Pyrinomonadaceae bacterium]
MKILIGGSHGLVGTALIKSLEAQGHEIFRLVRHAPNSKTEVEWSPDRYSIALARIEGFDAVVNLAGESIAEGRWTDDKKRRIRESRVKGTKLLGDALANLTVPPKTFVCASAIGYYGNRGDELLTEASAPGDGFLSKVCAEWEEATALAIEKGIRVVNARFGVILDTNGGALKKMLPPFRMGVGGRIGSGKQWMSWIALDDVIGALNFALKKDSLRGPVNFVAPAPVINAEFTKTLGKVLSRPTIFPIPAFAIKLMFGEMGEALLLGGQRVAPERLTEAGYAFHYSVLDSALHHVLDKRHEEIP